MLSSSLKCLQAWSLCTFTCTLFTCILDIWCIVVLCFSSCIHLIWAFLVSLSLIFWFWLGLTLSLVVCTTACSLWCLHCCTVYVHLFLVPLKSVSFDSLCISSLEVVALFGSSCGLVHCFIFIFPVASSFICFRPSCRGCTCYFEVLVWVTCISHCSMVHRLAICMHRGSLYLFAVLPLFGLWCTCFSDMFLCLCMSLFILISLELHLDFWNYTRLNPALKLGFDLVLVCEFTWVEPDFDLGLTLCSHVPVILSSVYVMPHLYTHASQGHYGVMPSTSVENKAVEERPSV